MTTPRLASHQLRAPARVMLKPTLAAGELRVHPRVLPSRPPGPLGWTWASFLSAAPLLFIRTRLFLFCFAVRYPRGLQLGTLKYSSATHAADRRPHWASPTHTWVSIVSLILCQRCPEENERNMQPLCSRRPPLKQTGCSRAQRFSRCLPRVQPGPCFPLMVGTSPVSLCCPHTGHPYP